MANNRHWAVLKQGVEAWNQWREQNLKLRPDLSGLSISLYFEDLSEVNFYDTELASVELDEVNLSGADFRVAGLFQADLSNANLQRAIFYDAYCPDIELNGADLRGAKFGGADLRYADLRSADLSSADLTGTNLTEANFRGADLSNAIVGHTVFANVDLSEVKGLETVRHEGPSTIGIDTLYRSDGTIPEVFLRGAGVPDTMLAFAASLVGQSIQFYSCFMSYSHQDQDFAERLYADLQSKGVRCWFAPKEMKIGEKIRSRIDESIRLHDKLLIILSKHSVHSDWVEYEVETALEKEQQSKKQGRERLVLFPIRLDDAVMETTSAWAAGIRRQRHIGDFRQWKDQEKYQKALNRLLRDLGAGP